MRITNRLAARAARVDVHQPGSFFGGTLAAVEWYARTYYSYFDHWRSAGYFVGKDQTVINGIMLMHPDRFVTVWNRDPNAPGARAPRDALNGFLGYCFDPWQVLMRSTICADNVLGRFYYIFYLAREDEKERMNDMWVAEWHWDFWNDRDPCRDTRALSAHAVLKFAFGQNWRPPNPVLKIPDESQSWVR